MNTKDPDNSKFLFKGFLSDKRVYNLCEGYWKRIIKNICEGHIDFFKNSYGNGLKIYDANPIVFFLYKNRGVRIILIDDEEFQDDFLNVPDYCITSYLDNLIYDEKEYKELVLSLFMSRSAVKEAKVLLRNWFQAERVEKPVFNTEVFHKTDVINKPQMIACTADIIESDWVSIKPGAQNIKPRIQRPVKDNSYRKTKNSPQPDKKKKNSKK